VELIADGADAGFVTVVVQYPLLVPSAVGWVFCEFFEWCCSIPWGVG